MNWINVFRDVAKRCRKVAVSLWGTEKAKEIVGKGAAGDTTIFMDKHIEDIAIDFLKKKGNVRIISEERGIIDVGSPEKIIIMDPLDGSLNAKSGIPIFSISLASADFPGDIGDVDEGYVYDFITGNEYVAIKDEGAWLNGRRIRTQESNEIRIISTEYYPRTVWTIERLKGIYELGMRIRTLGSIALDLCYLAQGIFSSVIEMRAGMCRALDISAGVLIVKEAGGIVTDNNGKRLEKMKIDFNSRKNIIASANDEIHKRVLRRIRRKSWCIIAHEKNGNIGMKMKKIVNKKDVQCVHIINPGKREINVIDEFLKLGNNVIISSCRDISLKHRHVYKFDPRKEHFEEFMKKWDIP